MGKEIHKNYSMCRQCGGKCCKGYAGSYVPEDFQQEMTADLLVSLLKEGKVAIDWWEGDARKTKINPRDSYELLRTCYLRPRHVNEGAIQGSWGGQCVNWSLEKGCSLSEKERPYQCRMLIPKMKDNEYICDTKKEDKASKQDIAIRWIPYQTVIEEAISMYMDKDE